MFPFFVFPCVAFPPFFFWTLHFSSVWRILFFISVPHPPSVLASLQVCVSSCFFLVLGFLFFLAFFLHAFPFRVRFRFRRRFVPSRSIYLIPAGIMVLCPRFRLRLVQRIILIRYVRTLISPLFYFSLRDAICFSYYCDTALSFFGFYFSLCGGIIPPQSYRSLFCDHRLHGSVAMT